MTRGSPSTRAAGALRDQADRLRAAALGRADEAEKIRQADALLRIAAVVAAGTAAVRAALGPVGTPSEGVTAADRERAGTTLFGLAQRRADQGTHRQLDAPAKPGWELGGNDLPIHRATLREAVELYELALALHYDSYWDYLRGLLHESLGEFAEAIRILDHLDGPYDRFGPQQAARCRAKLEAGIDGRSGPAEEPGRSRGAADVQAGLAKVLRGAFGARGAALDRTRDPTGPTSDSDAAPLESPGLERAERAARDFVEALANGDFEAARSMLSRDLRDIEVGALRARFEQMMGIDELDRSGAQPTGEATVMMMTADADMPNLGPRDLGWVYVAVTNARRNEAVTVVVTEEGGQARIRELEWGRP